MKYYLDSVIIIYLVEQVPEYCEKIDSILSQEIETCTSQLSILECKVKPLKEKNELLVNDFDYFLRACLKSQVYFKISKKKSEKLRFSDRLLMNL